MPGGQGVVTGTKRKGFISLRFRRRIPLLRPERKNASDVVMEKTAEEVFFMFKNNPADNHSHPAVHDSVPAESHGHPADHDRVPAESHGHPADHRSGSSEDSRNIFAPLRDIRVLTSAGLLSAIPIVLGFFQIPLTQIIEIRFMVLPVAAAGWLFGPVVGGLVGIVADVGGYLIKPTGPFFPGFTITSMLSGVIFGCVLYRRRPTLLRIFTAQVIYTLVCGLLLTSIWLSMLYGNGFIPVLTARILKELVLIPVNTIMLAALMEPVRRFRMTQGMTS